MNNFCFSIAVVVLFTLVTLICIGPFLSYSSNCMVAKNPFREVTHCTHSYRKVYLTTYSSYYDWTSHLYFGYTIRFIQFFFCSYQQLEVHKNKKTFAFKMNGMNSINLWGFFSTILIGKSFFVHSVYLISFIKSALYCCGFSSNLSKSILLKLCCFF